jgi:hypothetical protein
MSAAYLAGCIMYAYRRATKIISVIIMKLLSVFGDKYIMGEGRRRHKREKCRYI